MRGLIVLWALVGLVFGVLFFGGEQVPGCLGPIGITVVGCIDAQLAEGEVWTTGPTPLLAFALIVFPLGLLGHAAVPWAQLGRERARGVAALGVLGAIVGLAWFLGTSPGRLEGWRYDPASEAVVDRPAEWAVVPLALNPGLGASAMAFGAVVAMVAAGWFVVRRSGRPTA